MHLSKLRHPSLDCPAVYAFNTTATAAKVWATTAATTTVDVSLESKLPYRVKRAIGIDVNAVETLEAFCLALHHTCAKLFTSRSFGAARAHYSKSPANGGLCVHGHEGCACSLRVRLPNGPVAVPTLRPSSLNNLRHNLLGLKVLLEKVEPGLNGLVVHAFDTSAATTIVGATTTLAGTIDVSLQANLADRAPWLVGIEMQTVEALEAASLAFLQATADLVTSGSRATSAFPLDSEGPTCGSGGVSSHQSGASRLRLHLAKHIHSVIRGRLRLGS